MITGTTANRRVDRAGASDSSARGRHRDRRRTRRNADAQLTEVLRGEALLARVAPEQKCASCGLQAAGEIVAMTGDGVNDRRRCARPTSASRWISGTDVAKEAAR